jgi:multicomponent K+:H+ antiporter subunit G
MTQGIDTLLIAELPLWLTIPIVFFLIGGGLIILIGALGLLRLPSFYQRIHGPAVTITFGAGTILIASMLFFSGLEARPVVHELLITIFVFLTAPITSMLIMRAAVYRDLRDGKIEYTKSTGEQFPEEK